MSWDLGDTAGNMENLLLGWAGRNSQEPSRAQNLLVPVDSKVWGLSQGWGHFSYPVCLALGDLILQCFPTCWLEPL